MDGRQDEKLFVWALSLSRPYSIKKIKDLVAF